MIKFRLSINLTKGLVEGVDPPPLEEAKGVAGASKSSMDV